ncbi:hypothetical protein EHEL_020100 [Encephalitozoon hellem ATCC 50504]|uniref:Uncharacterized protein n=1 Tax=Encephalitozoon hellem TaxID=27973 RepID=A0A9Q9F7L1_ENCHE|nr:uncharacterized protein EHEL_020100 [Encephalitozoon hellem ATCC 50504]AFM97767.1 hypothetical protein EHEL_020100 [Encephalitozoon hellem ATCC 50504]UTX42534.1 hypothetical protein GPU96_02g02440 [Encephalitozoon hellem]WEL37989.1 hypothetical protein PFJ87_02g00250 [Encephalitozoon hellem]|eukprot:XP_003886748.1 hypothetical protein EHEL_020100 [Encephalitozoon hellem ATCC 50504]
MKILLLSPFVFAHVINLVILYEKTGLKEVKEMYHYVVERLLDKFNEHLQRRGIRISLLDFLAYDDYLVKPGYQDISIMGGEESLDARIEALSGIPANVILVASASPEEEREKFIPNTPCMSRFISNMVSSDIVDDELLTKIIYAVLDWMAGLFKIEVPSPVKERSPEVFDKFAKDVTTPEFIESLKQCTKETRDRFEKFIRVLNWDEEKMFSLGMMSGKLDSGKSDCVEISSPLKWVLSKSEKKPEDTNSESQSPKETKEKKDHSESSSNDESSSEKKEKNTNRKHSRTHKPKETSSKKVKKISSKKINSNNLTDTEESEKREMSEEHEISKSSDSVEYIGKANIPRNEQRQKEEALMEEKIREELKRIISREPYNLRRKLDGSPAFTRISPYNDGEARGTQPKILFSSRATSAKNALKTNRGLSYGKIPYRRGYP